jgi:PKD repeat protein
MKWQYLLIAILLLVGTVSATTDWYNMSVLHFTGVNGTQTIKDENVSVTWGVTTSAGLPWISTIKSEFNGSSLMENTKTSSANALTPAGSNGIWVNNQNVNQSFTVSYWQNFSYNGVPGDYVPVDYGVNTTSGSVYGSAVADFRSWGDIKYYTMDRSCQLKLISTVGATGGIDGWHYVMMEKNGTANNFTAYYDGNWQGTTQNILGTCPNTNIMILGTDGSTVSPFPGYIDEVVVTNGTARTYAVPVRETEYNGGKPVASYVSNISKSFSAPFAVEFADRSINMPTMWNWSYNTSIGSVTWVNKSVGTNVTITFPSLAPYLVNLTVSNALGSDTYSGYIFGNQTTAADFNGTPRYAHPFTWVYFVDMSTGGGLNNWSWDTGFLRNQTYIRNPSFQYNVTGTYNVNLTVTGVEGVNTTNKTAYIRINWNNTFTLVVRDADTFQLITTTDLVKLSQIGVDYAQQPTVNGIATFELPDGTYDVMASAIPGEYGSNIASVTMAGTDATGTIYLTPVSSGSKTVWYTQKQIRFTIVDAYQNSIPGANITANYISDSFPNTTVSWISSAFGVSSAVASEMVNNGLAMIGESDQGGAAVFMMFPGIKYGITITNTTMGLSKYTVINPQETDYVIMCPLASQSQKTTSMADLVNSTLYVSEPNSSYISFNLLYHDLSGYTTYLVWNITQWSNNTWMYTNDFGNVGGSTIIDNYTVPNVRGQEWKFWYNATRNRP